MIPSAYRNLDNANSNCSNGRPQSCCMRGCDRRPPGVAGGVGRNHKGAPGNFESLDCDVLDYLHGVCMSKFIKLYPLNMCSL